MFDFLSAPSAIEQEAHYWRAKAEHVQSLSGHRTWAVKRGPWWGRYWTLLIERPTTIPQVKRDV